MASLISAAEKAVFTGALNDLFDTFKEDIIIYKEAKIQYINIDQPRIFGYNDRVDISNINYIPVTGVFPALVRFNKDQDTTRIKDLGNFTPQGEVSIKIKQDARDYIANSGATIGISIQDSMYKIISFDSSRRFISTDYYIYFLERQK